MVEVNKWSGSYDGTPHYEITYMSEQEYLALRDLMAWAISEKQKGVVAEVVRTNIWDMANHIYDAYETDSWDNDKQGDDELFYRE
ncbi:MAG: hypothetical protein CMB80_02155 [Flammeovirgaceae bacterium]|nr:hypothetical protein [Flammeovirgaceae bacterium]